MTGRAVLGRLDDAALQRFAGSKPVRAGFDLEPQPWHVHDLTCVGAVEDDEMHAAAIDAALRGADIVVDVSPERAERFATDLIRAGVELWNPRDAQRGEPEWAPLLDELVAGASVQDAARRCNVSLRTAHRRLAQARDELGVTSTAEVIAVWSTRRSSPRSTQDQVN